MSAQLDWKAIKKQCDEFWAKMTPEEKAAYLRKQGEGWAKSEAQWAKDFREGKTERD